MPKTKNQLKSEELIADINRLFAETKSRLGELHLKKMELIKYYRDLENKKELAKIRAKIQQG